MRWYRSVGHFTFKVCFLAIPFEPECLFNINHFLLWKILKNISFILWISNVKQASRSQLQREKRSINFIITSILFSLWFTLMSYIWGNIFEFFIPSYILSETLFFVKDLDWKRIEAINMSLFGFIKPEIVTDLKEYISLAKHSLLISSLTVYLKCKVESLKNLL